MSDLLDAKKEIADEVLTMLTPHMSTQLGANLGYGVNTMGNDLLPQATEAIKIWAIQGDSNKLIATIMTAVALGVVSETQADAILVNIKKIDKQEEK